MTPLGERERERERERAHDGVHPREATIFPNIPLSSKTAVLDPTAALV
jgi:hypothetical protein